jgi:tetratricopeptide (TPR) repeat protein
MLEKTVFFSYRRINVYAARAVYQDLTSHGYDCFLDYESINAGSFEQVILTQIAARAHFVLILAPGVLDRCADPGDWLRREIEYALELKRSIIPLLFDGFRFREVRQNLTGKLKVLPKYNALEVHSAYFEEAMERLRARFLAQPLAVVLHPMPSEDEITQPRTDDETQPTAVSAQDWLERGFRRDPQDRRGKIADYTEALQRDPTLAVAYHNRGWNRDELGDAEGAIADYTEALRLNPRFTAAYVNRSASRGRQGDYEGAIADATLAVLLNPRLAEAYYNRGVAYTRSGDLERAVTDFTIVIDLNPMYVEAYRWRGIAYQNQGNLAGANRDFGLYIKLDGTDSNQAQEWLAANEAHLHSGQ